MSMLALSQGGQLSKPMLAAVGALAVIWTVWFASHFHSTSTLSGANDVTITHSFPTPTATAIHVDADPPPTGGGGAAATPLPSSPSDLVSVLASSPPVQPLERITDRVATIFDTKITSHTIPLVLHYSTFLGPDWPIVFFTTQAVIDTQLDPADGAKRKRMSAKWLAALADKRIQLRPLPDAVALALGDRESINLFMSHPWWYEQLAPAVHMLVFQADTVLCTRSEFTIDDFLQWDFIGSPMGARGSPVYNGGLCLRNRTMLLEIMSEHEYTAEWDVAPFKNFRTTGEDLWFSTHIRNRGGKVPTWEEAQKFATVWPGSWYEWPLGYHKPMKTMPEKMDKIREYCPEIGLAMVNFLKGEEDGRAPPGRTRPPSG